MSAKRKKKRDTHRRVSRSPSRRHRAIEDGLQEYVAHVRKGLGKKLVTWIRLANYDLHYGPLKESGGGYGAARAEDIAEGGKAYGFPGFQKAMKIISENLDALGVHDLYVNTFAGGWSDVEPDWGEVDEEGYPYDNPEDWSHVTRREVLSAIVGRELAEYVS